MRVERKREKTKTTFTEFIEWVFYFQEPAMSELKRRKKIRLKIVRQNLFLWIDSQRCTHQENWHGNTEKCRDEHKLEQGENAAAEEKSEGSSNQAQKVRSRSKRKEEEEFIWI